MEELSFIPHKIGPYQVCVVDVGLSTISVVDCLKISSLWLAVHIRKLKFPGLVEQRKTFQDPTVELRALSMGKLRGTCNGFWAIPLNTFHDGPVRRCTALQCSLQ